MGFFVAFSKLQKDQNEEQNFSGWDLCYDQALKMKDLLLL